MEQTPHSKVHGANMGPILGGHNPVGPHVGPMDLAIWDTFKYSLIYQQRHAMQNADLSYLNLESWHLLGNLPIKNAMWDEEFLFTSCSLLMCTWFCFVLVKCYLFIHVILGYLTEIGEIIWMPQCQQSNPEWYGSIWSVPNHNKTQETQTMWIILGTYCTLYNLNHACITWYPQTRLRKNVPIAIVLAKNALMNMWLVGIGEFLWQSPGGPFTTMVQLYSWHG